MARVREAEEKIEKLIQDKSWRGHLTIGVILLLTYGLLISPFFTGIKWLADSIFLLGGNGFLFYGVYQYFEERSKEK